MVQWPRPPSESALCTEMAEKEAMSGGSDTSERYTLQIHGPPAAAIDEEFNAEERERLESAALEMERGRMEELLRAKIIREEQLGARHCDPGGILNEAESILRAISQIKAKKLPGAKTLLEMANKALSGRLEPPVVSSMVAAAAAPSEAGPMIRRVAASCECILLIAAPVIMDLPYHAHKEQVTMIMSEEKRKMIKNGCGYFLPHLYNGLRLVRVIPGRPITLDFKDVPVLSCKCTPVGQSLWGCENTEYDKESYLAVRVFTKLGYVDRLDSEANKAVAQLATLGAGGTPGGTPNGAQREAEPSTNREDRIFTLAGFIPELLTDFNVQWEKERMTSMITGLGGRINESDEWVGNTTHVVNLIPGPHFGMSEKAMAGIAAGRWVVTKIYVEESHLRGKWLDNEKDFLAPPGNQVLSRKLKALELGDRGLLFHNMVAAIIMEDRHKAQVFGRVFKAGGGTVVEATKLSELVEMYPVDLTHVFMVPWTGSEDLPGLSELADIGRETGLHLCDYKLLFHKVMGSSLANEEEWQICGPRAKLNAEDEINRRRCQPVERAQLMVDAGADTRATAAGARPEETVPAGPAPCRAGTKRARPTGTVPKTRPSQGTATGGERAKTQRGAEDVSETSVSPGESGDMYHELYSEVPPGIGAPAGGRNGAAADQSDESMPRLTPSTSPILSSPGVVNSLDTESSNGEEEFCVICQEMIEAQSRCVLSCLHVIHVSCAETWLAVSPTCPNCRERCNMSNPALLPPGVNQSRAYSNGAVLTNQLQPDGRPPISITVERLPARRPTRSRAPGIARQRPSSLATTTNVRQGASEGCSAGQTTRRTRSTPRANLRTTNRANRARTVAALRTSTSRRGRLVNASPTTRMAVRRMDLPGNHFRDGNRHWSQQIYSRSPEGPWRRPSGDAVQIAEVAEPRQTNTERGLRRAFVDGFTFGSVTIGVSPQERVARYNELRQGERTRSYPPRRSEVFMERLSGLATNAMYLVVICIMLLSLPRANGSMIQPIQPSLHQDPSVITSFRAGDVLAFENNPRSVSLGMTSEAVDVSILFKLKEQLWRVVQHAGELGSNNLVSGSACEHFCQPMGYATKLTQVLKKDLRMPHYVFTKESHNSPEKTYFVVLMEDGKKRRFCNYSLSHAATFSLTSALDLGSPYYTESRSEKYSIYNLWLEDDRGLRCEDGVNVKRGEILPADADYEVQITHPHGSLWGCVEVCRNVNGLRETALKYPGCVLGQDCKNYTHRRCEVWSYNWVKSRCRISSLPDPGRDLSTYNGYNALMANHQCRSRQQHQSTLILVNETLHEVSRVCKYSEVQPPSSQHLYRSCPGVADSLLTDVIPLTTSLEGYVMSLGKTVGAKAGNNGSIKLNLEDVKKEGGALTSGTERSHKEQRVRRSIPVTALAATLRPSLSSFLHLGQAHLSSGIGKIFLGSALPMGNLLLLTTNILTMIVNMASGLPSVAHFEASARLEEARREHYQDWRLISTPDLHTLAATNDICNAEDILTADSIPSLLRGMHESLMKLQGPLKRILEDTSPISNEVRGHIEKQGRDFGFWSRYLEDQNLVIRYFAFKITGRPESSVTQVAVLAGNSLSPVIQGTVIAGGARRPGTTTPSWSCIGFVKEKGDQDLPWIPKECYRSPILSNSEIYTTNFMPDAQLIRVWGQHSLGHSCPTSPPGIIQARGLLVFVIGRECQLTMDGVHVRPEDRTAESPWARPVLLVDRTEEYPMPQVGGALYPKQLAHAIASLTNESIHPALEGIKKKGEDESQARATIDQALGVILCLIIIMASLAMLVCYKRAVVWQWIRRTRSEEEVDRAAGCLSWMQGREEPNTTTLEMDNQPDSVNA